MLLCGRQSGGGGGGGSIVFGGLSGLNFEILFCLFLCVFVPLVGLIDELLNFASDLIQNKLAHKRQLAMDTA